MQELKLLRASSPAERRRFERHVSSGELVAPIRGMFMSADEWNELSAVEQSRQVVQALASIHKNWVFCLFSAAAVYGLEVAHENTDKVHRQVAKRPRVSRNGKIISHKSSRTESRLVGEVRVTPPVQTVVDCLCALEFPRALAIADSAMRVLGLSKEEMQAELDGRNQPDGYEIARDAIAYANPLAANGGESAARAVMIQQGFMIPQLQVRIPDPLDSAKEYFADFYWDLGQGGVVVGELDGRDKYVLPEMTQGRDAIDVMRDERRRESRITAGARVLRFSYGEVIKEERFTQMLTLYGIPRGAARRIGG